MAAVCAVQFPPGLGSIRTGNASVHLVRSRQEIKALVLEASDLCEQTRKFLGQLKTRTYIGDLGEALGQKITTLEGKVAVVTAKVADIANCTLAGPKRSLQTLCANIRSNITLIRKVQPVFMRLQEIETKLTALLLALKKQHTTFIAIRNQCLQLRNLFAAVLPAIDAVKCLTSVAELQTEFKILHSLYSEMDTCLVSTKILLPWTLPVA